MDLKKLKKGADWMTPEEKECCKQFVTGMQKTMQRSGIIETPLLVMRMNAVISTYLQARRLEAYIAPEPVVQQTNRDQKTENQTGQQPDEQPSQQTDKQTEAKNKETNHQSEDQPNKTGEGTQGPTPEEKREARAQTISLIKSIGKAWERNGKAMKDLEANCAMAGAPIELGIAEIMKPTILKASGIIEESIREEKRRLEAEKLEPPQSEAKSDQND